MRTATRKGPMERSLSRRVVEYTSCSTCQASVGIQANGRIVRHSFGFGYAEKVGPGTAHPSWKTTICKGSGYRRELSPVGKRNAKRLAEKLTNHDDAVNALIAKAYGPPRQLTKSSPSSTPSLGAEEKRA